MALNVEQITNRLAQMPDAALQKYAAMNKNDPYIMALAVSESNRRKQMRQAAQGAQGQMPQPKVVDAAVQNMAAPMPEDMGIARLPAGDMNFADGGIVAFADGGDVERYQVGGMPPLSAGTEYGVEGMTTGDLYQKAMAKYQQGQPLSDVEKALLTAATPLAAVADTAMLPITAVRKLVRSPLDKSEEPSWFPLTGAATSKIAAELPPQASYSNEGRRQPGLFAAAPTAAPAATEKPAPTKDTQQRGPSPAAPRADSGFAALQKQIDAGTAPASDINPYVKQMEELTATRVKGREKEAEGLEAIQKQYADVFKGREKRLTEREGELAGMKDQSLGLALLQAGAAMMSTPGSLGTAIGKGVDVGSRQYVAGMDKLNAAKEKLSDARDRLEELQAQRGEMSARELLKAKSAIDTEKAAGQELLIKANMDLYKISREEAIKRLELSTRLGIAQLQEQGASARANALPGEIRTAMMLGTGNTDKEKLESGLKRLQEVQSGKFNVTTSYADYLKAFAGKETLTPPLSFTQYAAQFGATLPR